MHEPRHLWRRFFALLVDLFLASILAMLIAWPIVRAAPDKLQLTEGFFRVHLCKQITSFPARLETFIDGREIDQAQFCQYRPNLIFPPQYVAEIRIVQPKEPGARINRYVELEIAARSDGALIEVVTLDNALMPLVLLLGAALCLARGVPTPGKALLGLRIQGQGCALCREVRRIGPFVLLGFLEVAIALSGIAFTVPWVLVGAIALTVFAAFFYYYLWPLFQWRGAMRYDRATGFSVVRKTEGPYATP